MQELDFKWLHLTLGATDTLYAYFASNTMSLRSIHFSMALLGT
jgi:hypothetical protein